MHFASSYLSVTKCTKETLLIETVSLSADYHYFEIANHLRVRLEKTTITAKINYS